ncbi:MAG: glycosyltransferase family 4 protein [Rikenellaceae bacterium]|nr:glycosyltransferase family 4 protein [Rikenellaceae bacterium]
MKILYCIAGTCNSGGMERVLANKANYLVSRGYVVVIATTDQRGRAPFFVLDERIRCYDLGINYDENNGKSLFNKLLHYPFKQHRHKRRLNALLAEERPDVVVSMFCNEASIVPALQDGSRKVLEIHFSKFKRVQYARRGLWRLVDLWRSRMDERLVRRYDRFVVLTEEDRGYWGALPNIEVIPNARTFNPATKADLRSKRVVAVGRYTHQKGFECLLEAWARIANQSPDWQLDLVGEGEDRAMLQASIDRLGIGDSARLTGTQSDMDALYRSASVVALSSRYEGLPMILLEAQAYGLPIVSFACKCGPRDIVTDGVDGFLVEEGDIEALASRLGRVMQDEELRLRMGEAAALASMRFDEERIMDRWINLFTELTAQR